jgi:NDP-sugar pyrophosphorylase family protein
MQAADFFSLPPSLAAFAAHFPADVPPWEWVRRIGPALREFKFEAALPPLPPGVHAEGFVHLDPTVKLPAYATIIGPAWIGPRTEIRPGAYIRGNVIAGAGCVLGNACEFKNCLLLDGVQAPHFNYVGDSILGNKAHLGAGVICSNFRLDQQPVVLRLPEGDVATGLRKLGALIGDGAEVGCNAALQPGALLGRRSLVMPLTAFGGCLPANTLVRDRHERAQFPRRD